jgi:hypothetical protein
MPKINMKYLFYCLLAYFFCLVLPTSAFAQDEETDSINYYYYEETEETNYTVLQPEQTEQAKAYQNEKIEVKKFDEKQWQEIVGEETFSEKVREKKEKNKNDSTISPVAPWIGLVLRVLAYVFLIGIVIAIIWLIIKNTDAISGSLQKRDNLFANLQQKIEDINEVDLEAWLAQAKAENNLKAIIRIHYLITLRNLQRSGFIKYQKDKTNRDYLFEMLSKPHAQQFKSLTLAYEWIWYGEISFSNEQFKSVEEEFLHMNQSLTQTTHAA